MVEDFIHVPVLVISDCNGENTVKSVNRNQRYHKNKSGTVFFGSQDICSYCCAVINSIVVVSYMQTSVRQKELCELLSYNFHVVKYRLVTGTTAL